MGKDPDIVILSAQTHSETMGIDLRSRAVLRWILVNHECNLHGAPSPLFESDALFPSEVESSCPTQS